MKVSADHVTVLYIIAMLLVFDLLLLGWPVQSSSMIAKTSVDSKTNCMHVTTLRFISRDQASVSGAGYDSLTSGEGNEPVASSGISKDLP